MNGPETPHPADANMAGQTALFDPDPRTLARTSDPATSHAAAATLPESAKSIRAALLAVITRRPSTADDAAHRIGDPPGAWKRVSDLKTAGLIEPTGELALTRAGRQAIVWRAVR